MSNEQMDIIGIGAALVDVFADITDEDLSRLNMPKGAMTLIDINASKDLLGQINVHTSTAGGSAANTIAGTASIGMSSGFIGKIANDSFGDIFANDLSKMNIKLFGQPLNNDTPTGKCIVLITPDAERTMNTLIGAAAFITPEDLDAEVLKQTKVFFAEGYLFDSPQGVETFFKACDMVHAGGGKVVLSLSDSFCVERHLDTFNQALAGPVDMVMSNDAEAKAMFGGTSIQDRIAAMQQKNIDGVITRSADGAVIVMSHEVTEIAAEKVDQPVDLTGAGDQFAAGFLSGVASGKPMENAGRRGAVAAAEVIKHVGPRPQVNLQDLIKAANLA